MHPNLDQLRNTAYSGIYENPVTLKEGVYEGAPFAEEGAVRPRLVLIEQSMVNADLNDDGSEESIVVLAENSGGTGEFSYLAAVGMDGERPKNIGTILLGDRVQIRSMKTEEGLVILDMIVAGPNDAMCCPTLKVRKAFGLKDGELAELQSEELGTLSLSNLEGTTWVLKNITPDQPIPEGIEITAEFTDGRVAGSAGCNRYFATVVPGVTPGELTINAPGSTRMSCPGPVMETEQRFLTALAKVGNFSFTPGGLVLSYESDGTWRRLEFLEQRETE